MQQFKFEILYHLIGIGSASGLFYKPNSVFVISDSGNSLYEYRADSGTLSKTPLSGDEPADNIPKHIKPDFESIAHFNDTLYIFGSGSTENRMQMIAVEINTKKVHAATDLAPLYATMQSFANISAADFNIEGAVYDGKSWYFFQRGNGGTGINGVFTVTGDIEKGEFSVLFNRFKLPKIGRVECSFTDAVLLHDKIYFIATAEDTKSTYDDGEILGSIIGRLDPKKMKIEKTLQITDKHKLEGITVYSETAENITFLLCEDNDTHLLESDIFKLQIKK